MSAQVINMHEQFVWSMDNLFISDSGGFDLDLGENVLVHVRESDVVAWKRLRHSLIALTLKRPAYRRLVANMPPDLHQSP